MTGAPPSRFRRGFAGVALMLLVAVLPALVAGRQLDAPPTPEEVALLRAAREPLASGPSPLVGGYLLATAPAGDLPEGSAARAQFVARARRVQLPMLFVLAGLTMLLAGLAGSAREALLATLLLAVTAPILERGHLLRPEVPAALFTLLVVVLLVMAMRFRPRGGHAVATAGAVFGSAVAVALAVVADPSSAAPLLVPAAGTLVATAATVLHLVPLMRRQRWALWPGRAFMVRLLPWVGATLLAMAVTAWLLSTTFAEPPRELERIAGGPFPAGVAGVVLALVTGLGVLALLLRVGRRLAQRARLGAEGIVLVAAAVGTAVHAARPAGRGDALPVAALLALLAARGVVTVVWLVLAVRARGR